MSTKWISVDHLHSNLNSKIIILSTHLYSNIFVGQFFYCPGIIKVSVHFYIRVPHSLSFHLQYQLVNFIQMLSNTMILVIKQQARIYLLLLALILDIIGVEPYSKNKRFVRLICRTCQAGDL